MKNWLKKRDACEPGYKWAIANCKTMQDVWDTAKPEWLIWVATRKGCLTDRELWEFALWSAEQVRNLMTDERSTNALDVRRRWLDSNATDDEMIAAGAAAGATARAAAWDAAGDAARAAAWDAARDAAWDAARDAAWDAARDAAWAAQADWLRENCKPNFDSLA
jgi:hypothetical protein